MWGSEIKKESDKENQITSEKDEHEQQRDNEK